MPFLLWLPMIIMAGMWNVAEENTRAFSKISPPRRYSQYLQGGKSRL
jgi:hypothetical protein